MTTPDFATRAELVAHYKAVQARLHGPRTVRLATVAPQLKLPPTATPRPRKSLREAIITLKSLFDPATSESDPIQMEDLIRVVIKVTGIQKIDLLSNRRYRPTVEARQLFYWLARTYTIASFPSIGRRCGLKDHSTVKHGADKVNALLKVGDQKWQSRIDACLAEMGK